MSLVFLPYDFSCDAVNRTGLCTFVSHLVTAWSVLGTEPVFLTSVSLSTSPSVSAKWELSTYLLIWGKVCFFPAQSFGRKLTITGRNLPVLPSLCTEGSGIFQAIIGISRTFFPAANQ